MHNKPQILDIKEKRKQYLRFVICFLILVFVLQAITHLRFITEPFTYATTLLTYKIIKLFYPSTVLNGFHILGGIDMEIIYECTGIYGIIVFTAAVASTWFAWIEKMKAILWGLPVILLLNLIRLVTIFLISQQEPKLFSFFHTFFWQFFLLFFVVFLFYLWLDRMTKKQK